MHGNDNEADNGDGDHEDDAVENAVAGNEEVGNDPPAPADGKSLIHLHVLSCIKKHSWYIGYNILL